jgi:glycosyltransferase involved in cell wall biosynthesis
MESKVSTGVLTEGSFKYFLQKKYEQITYFLSNKVFVVSEAIAEILKNKLKVKKEKIVVVEHSVDLKIFRRNVEEGNKIKKKLVIGRRPVLIYVGNPWVGIDKMIEFFSKMLLENNAFLILIISKSPSDPKELFEKIEKAVERNKISKNVKILYNVPHSELYKYLSAADIGLNIIPKKLAYVVSNKIKEYIACGVPVACKCSKNCYSKKVIETYKIGFTSETWSDFIQKIKKTIQSKQKLEEMRMNALKTSKEFSYEKIGKKVLLVIKDCLKENGI